MKAIALIALCTLLAACASTGSAVAEQTVSIPLSDLSSTAQYYEYPVGSVTVRFFAVTAADGSIKTAFDACDVCGSQKKGYRQEGDQMVCNNCGNRYPIAGLGTQNTRGGGCWPGYLPNEVQGDQLVFKVSDLEAGRHRFV